MRYGTFADERVEEQCCRGDTRKVAAEHRELGPQRRLAARRSGGGSSGGSGSHGGGRTRCTTAAAGATPATRWTPVPSRRHTFVVVAAGLREDDAERHARGVEHERELYPFYRRRRRPTCERGTRSLRSLLSLRSATSLSLRSTTAATPPPSHTRDSPGERQARQGLLLGPLGHRLLAVLGAQPEDHGLPQAIVREGEDVGVHLCAELLDVAFPGRERGEHAQDRERHTAAGNEPRGVARGGEPEDAARSVAPR